MQEGNQELPGMKTTAAGLEALKAGAIAIRTFAISRGQEYS